MYGYKISFKGLPKTAFACSAEMTDYNWVNHHNKNTVEISIGEAETFRSTINGQEHILENCAHLACVVGKDPRSASAEPGTRVLTTTVAVRFESLQSIPGELTKDDAHDHRFYLLPALAAEFSEMSALTRLLHAYINGNVSGTAYDNAACVGYWFEMLSMIDKATRRMLVEQKSRAENYYVKKLNYIIEKDYAQKLSLAGIAREFDISLSYLSSVYSAATKESFSKALLRVRMTKARELIDTTDLSCEEIAAQVGVCDVTYLRKRFKKFYGVSISEYKNINRGLTLYHEKPTRE